MPASWTTPRTWTAGELVTASIGNSAWRDNFMYLKDSPTFDGAPTVTGALTLTGALVGNATTDSTSITTGAFQTDGGLGVAKALWVGGLANIAGAATLQGTLAVSDDITLAATKKFRLDGSPSGNTYIYEAAADTIDLVAGAAINVRVTATSVSIGSAANFSVETTKRIYYDGGGDTYEHESASNVISWVNGGGANMRLHAVGSLSIGTTTDGVGAAGGLTLADTGGLVMATWRTTGSAANANVTDGSFLARSTSSLKKKIVDHYVTLDEARAMLAAMPMPIVYAGKEDADQRLWLGFGAEDVAPKVPLLATYDGENMTGDPNYVTYDRVPAMLSPIVRDHDIRIPQLAARIAALEARA